MVWTLLWDQIIVEVDRGDTFVWEGAQAHLKVFKNYVFILKKIYN